MAEYYGDDWPEAGAGLAHYGVKGMKWGVRKEESSSSNSSSDNGGGGGGDDTEDDTFSDQELKDMKVYPEGGSEEFDDTENVINQMRADEAGDITKDIYKNMAKLKIQEMSDKALDFGSKIADSLFGKSASRQMADRQRTVNMNASKRKIRVGDDQLKSIGRKRGLLQTAASISQPGAVKYYKYGKVQGESRAADIRKKNRR